MGQALTKAPLKLGRADRSECTKPVETAGSGKPIVGRALRVRGFDWDLRRAKGIMASGTCKGRMIGRTHDRTAQHVQKLQKILANAGPSTHDPMQS